MEAAGSLTASPRRRSGSPEARRLVCWVWPRMAKYRVVLEHYFDLWYRLVAQTGTKGSLVPVGGTNRYQRSTKNCARTALPLVPVFLTNWYQRVRCKTFRFLRTRPPFRSPRPRKTSDQRAGIKHARPPASPDHRPPSPPLYKMKHYLSISSISSPPSPPQWSHSRARLGLGCTTTRRKA